MNINNGKGIWLLGVLGMVITILLCILIFVPAKSSKNSQAVVSEGIQIITPSANEEVSSPIKISGVVSGNGWGGFEGQVGTVTLLDYKGNKIATGVLGATTDWTKLPTSFESTLVFQTKTIGPMILLFNNENPSGDAAKNKTLSLSIKVK